MRVAARQATRGHREVALLREMLRIRRFEERCAELYSAGRIRGFLHLYIGQEAIAAGAVTALRPTDAIVSTYREHGHALARGISARALMAELFGKATGCSGGRGGSMHVFDASRRFYGGFAIVAGGLPVAVGLALADRQLQRPDVTACFFGEGAAAEGEFHESLNLAALWRLPVLFLCENNRYAMGTALERSESQVDICRHARSYAIPARTVDGMDVVGVGAAVRGALGAIRRHGGPRFLQLDTYRFRAHSMYDPELYRARAEVDAWRERDPLVTFERRLRAAGQLDDAARAALESEVAAELDDAVAAAEAAPLEPVGDLARHVYAEVAAPCG